MNYINLAVLWLADPEGKKILYGGMERWCRDFACLCEAKGYKVKVFQKANKDFSLPLTSNIEIVGLRSSLKVAGHYEFYRKLKKRLSAEEPICFVSKELALGKYFKNSIGVDHGIWWDGDCSLLELISNKYFQYRFIHNHKALLCVDTNFINWCHAELPQRQKWQQKLHYVPNYVDTELFYKCNGNLGELRKNVPVILFPRRTAKTDKIESLMAHNRGAGLLLQAARILLERGLDFQLIFCGRDSESGAILKYATNYGFANRIKLIEVPFDEMPGVYSQASVVVVPTIAHEGTSLSAIESIGMGIPTVVSHIGGLCNIVIPGYNGFVSDLSPLSLADNIMSALQSPNINNEVINLFRNAISKSRWEDQVWNYCIKYLDLELS